MPRFGTSLQDILHKCDKYISNASIFNLGLQILNILELIHNSGIVYNDLKPDNILAGYGDQIQNSDKKTHEDIFENV